METSAYGRAFEALNQIRDDTELLRRDGKAVPALPQATMRTLQRAASGEAVREAELSAVLEAAEALAYQLGWRVLSRRGDGAV